MINSESGLTFACCVRDGGDRLLDSARGQAQLAGVLVRHAVRSTDWSRVVADRVTLLLLTDALCSSSLFTALGTKLTVQV